MPYVARVHLLAASILHTFWFPKLSLRAVRRSSSGELVIVSRAEPVILGVYDLVKRR